MKVKIFPTEGLMKEHSPFRFEKIDFAPSLNLANEVMQIYNKNYFIYIFFGFIKATNIKDF